MLTEEEATATTPSMLERVQAERVGGNVSEKKRVFLSLFSVFHTDLSGTRSALCGAKCLSEGIRHHSVRSYKLSPRYCVCALPFSLSFSVSLIFWLFSHLEKQWQQTRWSPVQNNYCVLSWFSHTVVKTAQQPAFSQETSVAALNLFGFGDSSNYGNNFITKSLSMQPSQDDCTSRLVRGKCLQTITAWLGLPTNTQTAARLAAAFWFLPPVWMLLLSQVWIGCMPIIICQRAGDGLYLL